MTLSALLLCLALTGACADGDSVDVGNIDCTNPGPELVVHCGGYHAVLDPLGTGDVLIVHPVDFPPVVYKPVNTADSPPPTNQDDGRLNWNPAFAVDHPAMTICQNLFYAGHADWYLPAAQEVEELFIAFSQGRLPGFLPVYHWSSSEIAGTQAVASDWSCCAGPLANRPKTNLERVACIRRG